MKELAGRPESRETRGSQALDRREIHGSPGAPHDDLRRYPSSSDRSSNSAIASSSSSSVASRPVIAL